MIRLRDRVRVSLAPVIGVLLLGCTDRPSIVPLTSFDGVASVGQGLPADRCINVQTEIDVPLGAWLLNGELAIGAAPAPVTLGGIEGWIASVVREQRSPGRSPTVHLRLNHVFVTDEPAVIGGLPAIFLDQVDSYFLTDDRAVCAAGSDPVSCRINDRMEIVQGAGIFQHAGGFLQNHGTLRFVPEPGQLISRLHGRICGDGLAR
jgi:hypothetical protein